MSPAGTVQLLSHHGMYNGRGITQLGHQCHALLIFDGILAVEHLLHQFPDDVGVTDAGVRQTLRGRPALWGGTHADYAPQDTLCLCGDEGFQENCKRLINESILYK